MPPTVAGSVTAWRRSAPRIASVLTCWRSSHRPVPDGILLCQHHHLLLHDNGWRVTRRDSDYFLVPPESLDQNRTPIPAPPATTIVKRMLATV